MGNHPLPLAPHHLPPSILSKAFVVFLQVFTLSTLASLDFFRLSSAEISFVLTEANQEANEVAVMRKMQTYGFLQDLFK